MCLTLQFKMLIRTYSYLVIEKIIMIDEVHSGYQQTILEDHCFMAWRI